MLALPAGIVPEAALAAEVVWVGESSATLAWDPPSTGIVDSYGVYVTRNGGPEVAEQFVDVPQATISGRYGDRISVRVTSIGRDHAGGPMVTTVKSIPSDPFTFVARPPSPSPSGLMLMRCAPCGSLRVHSTEDPTQYIDRFAPLAPWQLVGGGSARFPGYWQVWAVEGGAMVILTLDERPAVVASASSLQGHRPIQLAELDGDPEPEIITTSGDGTALGFWQRKNAEIVRFGQAMIPTGWRLVGAEDLDGDGRAELWFEESSSGTVTVIAYSAGVFEWRGQLSPGVPGQVAAVADLDGDLQPDLLWRDATGKLSVSLVDFANGEAFHRSTFAIQQLPGDDELEVKGVADLLPTPGLEILVQHTEDRAVGAITPLAGVVAARVPLLRPDEDYELVGTN